MTTVKGVGKTSGGKFPGNSSSTFQSQNRSQSTSSHVLLQKGEGQKIVSNLHLSTCLDLFIHIIQCAPTDMFLEESSNKVCTVLMHCFKWISHESEAIRQKLKKFLILSFVDRKNYRKLDYLDSVKIVHENSITLLVDSKSSLMANVWKASKFSQLKILGHCSGVLCPARFALHTIEEITELCPEFVQSFLGALVALAVKVAEDNVKPIDPKARTTANAIYPFVSPNVALFE